MAAPPGQVYDYSGGCTALIQAILKRATGQPLDALAHDLLFAPLGIKDVDWVRYPATGEPVAASGLRLLPRDFAALGQLVLQHGLWQGKQIVPAAFVAQATAPQTNGRGLYFYGYQFWLGRSFVGVERSTGAPRSARAASASSSSRRSISSLSSMPASTAARCKTWCR